MKCTYLELYNGSSTETCSSAYTVEEDQLILESQAQVGNRWSHIASKLPGRTEDGVKIRWKSLHRNLKKNTAGSSSASTIEAKDKTRIAYLLSSSES